MLAVSYLYNAVLDHEVVWFDVHVYDVEGVDLLDPRHGTNPHLPA